METSNSSHPLPGHCYNVDGFCDEDRCTCWNDPARLKKAIDDLKKKFPKWEEVANQRMKSLNVGGLVNDREDELIDNL